jgi:hypothetical protein
MEILSDSESVKVSVDQLVLVKQMVRVTVGELGLALDCCWCSVDHLVLRDGSQQNCPACPASRRAHHRDCVRSSDLNRWVEARAELLL